MKCVKNHFADTHQKILKTKFIQVAICKHKFQSYWANSSFQAFKKIKWDLTATFNVFSTMQQHLLQWSNLQSTSYKTKENSG